MIDFVANEQKYFLQLLVSVLTLEFLYVFSNTELIFWSQNISVMILAYEYHVKNSRVRIGGDNQ